MIAKKTPHPKTTPWKTSCHARSVERGAPDGALCEEVVPWSDDHRRRDADERGGEYRIQSAPLNVDEVGRTECGGREEQPIADDRMRKGLAAIRRNQNERNAGDDDRDACKTSCIDLDPVGDESDQCNPGGNRSGAESGSVARRRELQAEDDAARHPPPVEKGQRQRRQPVGRPDFARVPDEIGGEQKSAYAQAEKKKVGGRERRPDAKARDGRIGRSHEHDGKCGDIFQRHALAGRRRGLEHFHDARSLVRSSSSAADSAPVPGSDEFRPRLRTDAAYAPTGR